MQKGESRGRTELLQNMAVNMQQLWEQEKTFEVQAPASGDHGRRRSCCCTTAVCACCNPSNMISQCIACQFSADMCLCPSLQR